MGHTTLVNPLAYDRWYHFVVHAKREPDSTGVFEVWIDGSRVFSDTSIETLKNTTGAAQSGDSANPYTAPGMYLSQGYYSNASSNNTVYQDGMCRATTYEAAATC